MITVYAKSDAGIRRLDGEEALGALAEAAWIDLHNPRLDEIKAVEQALDITIPPREAMQEIESSSRLRREPHALHMTVTLLSNVATPRPQCGAASFILSRQRLVTLRYADPLPFKVFSRMTENQADLCASGTYAMIGLFGAIIDRLADIVEMAHQDVEGLAHEVFSQADARAGSQRYDGLIQRIGRMADVISKARESMMSLNRALTFLSHTAAAMSAKKELREQIKRESRDLASIAAYADFVNQKVEFLMDATLGLIGQQQNTIMKIFSVLAMIFLPPTLIGSIYGMNFHDMPELDWHLGYPLALALMVASAILPYLFFKRKGWL